MVEDFVCDESGISEEEVGKLRVFERQIKFPTLNSGNNKRGYSSGQGIVLRVNPEYTSQIGYATSGGTISEYTIGQHYNNT